MAVASRYHQMIDGTEVLRVWMDESTGVVYAHVENDGHHLTLSAASRAALAGWLRLLADQVAVAGARVVA
jgi:NAD(P)-dependent dehydrogenase (short-subunit alcohol dehydrogenase family)